MSGFRDRSFPVNNGRKFFRFGSSTDAGHDTTVDLGLDRRRRVLFVECEIIVSIFQVSQIKCQNGAYERIERCS